MGRKVVHVPQVMQMEAEECGAACLDMVCCYYRKWISLEQVRVDCGVSRDGSSALNLVKAARTYGFDTKSVSCDIDYLKNEASYPAILHWEFNHFVVLAGFSGGKAVINDPSKGRIVIGMDRLSEAFTGICLEFSPSAHFRTQGKKPSISHFMISRVSSMKRSIFFVMLATFLYSISSIIMPVFYRFFLDTVLPGGEKHLHSFLFAFLLLVCFQLFASILDEIALRSSRGRLLVLSDVKFMWHSLCLPLTFFSQRYSVDIANRQMENEQVSDSIINRISPLMANITLTVLYFILMLSYSVRLALVALGASCLNILSSRISAHSRMNYANTTMTAQAKLTSTTVNGISIIDTIKAAGAENGFFSRWMGVRSELSKSEVTFSKMDAFTCVFPSLMHRFCNLVVLALGSHMLMEGSFTVGVLMAFQSFLNLFMQPIESLVKDSQNIEEMATSVRRISDVMDYPEDKLLEERHVDEGEKFDRLEGGITVKDLSFGYSRMIPPVISHLDLEIKPKSQIAIIGPTGSGKSTLLKLILGLYQPWEGEVLFDGKSRYSYPREVMNSSVAVIDQDRKVFEGTLMDNLKLWDSTIDDATIIRACRDAMVHDEVMFRTGGYGCAMAEGGRNFSGGQLQRFEIARVLAMNPSVIVLDEATNALDADTEYKVMQNIRLRGTTMLVVSHRLSAIRDSDEILVVDQGKIVERGSHEELFKAGGLYSRLLTLE